MPTEHRQSLEIDLEKVEENRKELITSYLHAHSAHKDSSLSSPRSSVSSQVVDSADHTVLDR
jgi:hypothetical protein